MVPIVKNLSYLDKIKGVDSLWFQLVICIILDGASLVSSILDFTGAGILLNFIIAPIQTTWIGAMISAEKQRNTFMVIAFAEEIIPIFWIPSCSLAWIYKMTR